MKLMFNAKEGGDRKAQDPVRATYRVSYHSSDSRYHAYRLSREESGLVDSATSA
jgi:hypothetical protein